MPRPRTNAFALGVAQGLEEYAKTQPDDYLASLFDLLGVTNLSTRATLRRGEMIATANKHFYIDVVICTGGKVIQANPELIPPQEYVVPNSPGIHKKDRSWSRQHIVNYLSEWKNPNSDAYRAAEFYHHYNPDQDTEAMMNKLINYFSGAGELHHTESEISKEAVVQHMKPSPDGFGRIGELISEQLLDYVLQAAVNISTELSADARADIQQGILAMQASFAEDFHQQIQDFFSQLRADLAAMFTDKAETGAPLDTKSLIDELYRRLEAQATLPDAQARNEFAAVYSEELSKLLQLVNAFTLDPEKRERLLSLVQKLSD